MKLVTSFPLLLAAVLASTATSSLIIRAQVMLARNLGHAMLLCFRRHRVTPAGFHPVAFTCFHNHSFGEF